MEECIEHVRVYTGRIINLNVDRVRLQSGRESTREYVEHRGAVAAIPVLPDGRIVLVKQYRYPVKEYLIEIPAGTIELGEDPVQTMQRELVEEIGYRAGKLEEVINYYSTPGFVTERMYIYIATELEPAKGELDPEENIEVLYMTFEEAIEAIKRGDIKDGKTLVALALYGLSRCSDT